MVRAAILPNNYPTLQNLIKRDPASYETEFRQQYQHFKASLAIVQLRPSAPDAHFEDLLTFISHVAHCYPDTRLETPTMVLELLASQGSTLNPSLRRVAVQSLLLLRKHDLVSLVVILELFFRLLRLADKMLRELLYQSIVGEIRRANRPHKNNGLNKSLQNFMYSLFDEMASQKHSSGSGKTPADHPHHQQQLVNNSSNGQSKTVLGVEESLALDRILQIIIELYRKKVWDDARTVNVIAEAVVRRLSVKVMTTSLNFFVGRFRGRSLEESTNGASSDDDETDAQSTYRDLLHRTTFNGGSNKRSVKKKLKKALNSLHRKENRKDAAEDKNGSFAAIHLLNDPQGFVESLFGYLKRSTDTFELKLLMMNVISRVIGAHKLILLDFYSFLLRYIQPKQREVTHILAYAAQATHEQVPSDALVPLVTAIAHNFAAEHCQNEVIAAGLNGLREICSRCPEAMNADLLQDLANFKGYHDKGVVMAARSLIALYRQIDPAMLHRRDRGKEVVLAMKTGTMVCHRPGQTPYLDAQGIKIIAGGGDDENGEDVENDEKDNVADEETDSDDEDLATDEETIVDETVLSDDETLAADLQSTTSNITNRSQESAQVDGTRKDILQLAATKIFTATEFARLRKRMAGREEIEEADVANEEGQEDEEGGEWIDPRSLESSKRSKQDYAARIASIQAGREGRLKFGSRKGKHTERASISNRIKEKRSKNAIMLAHKPAVRAKKKRSLKEQQRSLLAHRKRQKMRK